MRLYSEKEGEMKITEEIAGKLRKHGNKMILGIRGEDIKFDPQNIDVYKENKMNAVVDNTEILGNENNLYFECGGATTVARVSKYELCRVGDEVDFVFVPHRMHFLMSGQRKQLCCRKERIWINLERRIHILMRIVYRERSCRYSMLHHPVDE